MTLSPRLRRLSLTAHIVSSVGWLGAVVVFLGLSLAGLSASDPQVVRSVYLGMDVTGWAVLVPLSLASLFTGLTQALGSKWGLLRHYWVITKLVINVVASVVLVLYMGTLDVLATQATMTTDDVAALRSPSPLLHTTAALVLLITAAVLSVYKPRGMTRRGWRRQQAERGVSQA